MDGARAARCAHLKSASRRPDAPLTAPSRLRPRVQPSISDGAILITMRTSVCIGDSVGELLASMAKLPPLHINTTGWETKFADHRMHVQTGPTPFGSHMPLGRLAFSTDAAKDIGGQLLVRPESLRAGLAAAAPSLRRVAIDARLVDVDVGLSAAFDLFGTQSLFGYTLSERHGLVSNLALSAALADDEIDLMQPSEFAIDLRAKCAATDPHACTMWPRPRPESAYLELASPTSSGGRRGGSVGLQTRMRKPSFLSTLLDLIIGVSHSVDARAVANGDAGVADASLDLVIDDYHAFTHGIFTHDPTGRDSGWKGLLNASVPAGDKRDPVNLAAGLTSIDKLKYELSGIGSHYGRGYRVVSHLDLGASKPLAAGLNEHGRRLQVVSDLNQFCSSVQQSIETHILAGSPDSSCRISAGVYAASLPSLNSNCNGVNLDELIGAVQAASTCTAWRTAQGRLCPALCQCAAASGWQWPTCSAVAPPPSPAQLASSEEPPAPVHFDLAVADLLGVGLDVHVNLDLVFDRGSVVLGGDLELNGVGATMNATVSHGCLFNWTSSCHTPLYADALVAPVGESLDFVHPIELNMTFDWHETEVNPISMRAALVSGQSVLDLGMSQEFIERTVAGEWEGAYTLAQRFSPTNIEWLDSTALDVHFTVGSGRLVADARADIAGSGATADFIVDTAEQSGRQSRRLSHDGAISNASFTFGLRPHAIDWLAALHTHGQLSWEPSSSALALVGEGSYNSTGLRISFAEDLNESPYTVGFQLWPSHIEDFEPLEMQTAIHVAPPSPPAPPSGLDQQQVNVRRHASSPNAHRMRPALRARLIFPSWTCAGGLELPLRRGAPFGARVCPGGHSRRHRLSHHKRHATRNVRLRWRGLATRARVDDLSRPRLLLSA